MTDIAETVDPGTTEEQAASVAAMEPAAEKPAKVKAQPKACYCSVFEIGHFGSTEGTAAEEIFTTGCEATTLRTFAQGHDARLVSFLVDGYFDKYEIRTVVDGVARSFATPADAVADVSNALQSKAEKATENRQAKNASKADKLAAREAKKAANAEAKAAAKVEKDRLRAEAAAAKAAMPKATGTEVVAGSAEGDTTPTPEGQVKIKVGRWEYNATVSEDGSATYLDGAGAEQTIERDGYRLLGE